MKRFEEATLKHKEFIETSGMLVPSDSPCVINREALRDNTLNAADQRQLAFPLTSYAMPDEMQSQLINSVSTSLITSFGDSAIESGSESDLSSSGSENGKCIKIILHFLVIGNFY